jgi:hypothetical protein
MNEQHLLAAQIRQWIADGRWIDRGRWTRPRASRYPAYLPTRKEIAEKCRLFRTIAGWHGANRRAPRGGEFGVPTTAGI